MTLRLALALAMIAGTAAHAQSPPACPPLAFARGQCDSIEAAPPHLLAEGRPTPLDGAATETGSSEAGQAPAEPTIHSDFAGRLALDQGWSDTRSQDAKAYAPAGVPSIRPMGTRPAVVVPLLSF